MPTDPTCREALLHVERRLSALLADVVALQRSLDAAPPAASTSPDTANRPDPVS